jgi:hypothetical protein
MLPLSRTCRRIALAAIKGNVSTVDIYVIYTPELRSMRFLHFNWRIGRGDARCYRSDDYPSARLCAQLEWKLRSIRD